MMREVVRFDRVGKQFGDVSALSDVSFSIRTGEIVALLGPNGAGKTTAIAIMLGLRRPTTGQAAVFGLDPGDTRARSRSGVMLQESGVSSMLTVRETVELFRTYYPAPLATDDVLGRAGLTDLAGRQIAKLSGGQKQRVYFALAICGDPDLLVLDEPTVGLDVETRRAFWEQVRATATAGKTIILTTHYLEEADALADRVIVIDRGSVIADASPSAIRSRVAGRIVSFDAPSLVRSHLDGLPISALELMDGHARFLSNEPEVVLRRLFGAGLDIQNLAVKGADLEEAFLALTRQPSTEFSSKGSLQESVR